MTDGMREIDLVDPDRFWSYVDRSGGPDACWVWSGRFDGRGYGEYRKRSVRLRAHRVAYELLVGPIPDGLDIDHLCRNKVCMNPRHLEPVTRVENNRRRDAARTHCKHGHEFTPKNTRVNSRGHRICRACQREGGRRWRQKKQPVARGDGLKGHPDVGTGRTRSNAS